jgi:HEAT repeat protein
LLRIFFVAISVRDPENSDARKVALIELLDIENRTVEREPQLSEAYTNYYGDVIAAVAVIADARSLDALVGAISTANMATGTLISFGNAAVEPVAKGLESPNPSVRSSVAWTLSRMLEKSREISSTPASRTIIKTALVRAAKDDYPVVRLNYGLVALGDPESIAIVDELARNDPYGADFKNGEFLVRDAAAKALKNRGR